MGHALNDTFGRQFQGYHLTCSSCSGSRLVAILLVDFFIAEALFALLSLWLVILTVVQARRGRC